MMFRFFMQQFHKLFSFLLLAILGKERLEKLQQRVKQFVEEMQVRFIFAVMLLIVIITLIMILILELFKRRI